MTSRFNSYAQDVELLTSEIEGKLQTARDSLQAPDASALDPIASLIDETNDILDSMELEVQSMPTSERTPYNTQMRALKSSLANYKSQLDDIKYNRGRNNLFGNDEYDGDEDAFNKRQALLSTNASIERSTQRLNDATRTALESETVGSSILNNLRTQRDQIISARDTLTDADDYVDRSLRTLTSMSRRMVQNKYLTYGIIVLLVLLILLTLYSKIT